jgi:hypothetical protein
MAQSKKHLFYVNKPLNYFVFNLKAAFLNRHNKATGQNHGG